MEQDAPKKRRRRRWPYVLLLLPVVLFVLVLGVLAALPWLYSPEKVRRLAEGQLSEMLGVPVEIGGLDYHPFRGVHATRIRVGHPDGFTRDLFRADALELRYHLGALRSKKVHVERLALIRPHVVLETAGGKRNLDVILARLASPKPEAEPEEKEPPDRTKPLSPVTVAIDDVRIEGLTFEQIGEGPEVRVSGLGLETRAFLDRKTLDAKLALTLAPEAGAPNLHVKLPPREEGRAPLEVEGTARLSFEVEAAGATAAGLTLGPVSAHLAIAAERLSVRGASPKPLPEIGEAKLEASLRADTSAGTARLEPLRFTLNGASIVEAGAAIEDLGGVLDYAMGKASADALRLQIGAARASGEGGVRANVGKLRVPLDVVLPYAAAYAPGLEGKGVVTLGPLVIEGSPRALAESAPRRLEAALAFDKVAVAHAPTGARLGMLDGGLHLWSEAATPKVRLGGTIALASFAMGPNAFDKGRVDLDGEAERITYPSLGGSKVTLGVELHGLGAGKTRARQLALKATVEGRDVLVPERDEPEPAIARVTLDGDGLQVGTGTQAIAISKLAMELGVRADRLVTASRKPVVAKLGVKVAKVDLAGSKTTIAGTKAELSARADDPRSGAPFSVTATLAAGVDAVAAPATRIARMTLDADARAAGMKLPGETFPNEARLGFTLGLPEIDADLGKEIGSARTSARLEGAIDGNPRDGDLAIKRLSLAIGEGLRFDLTGIVKHALSPRPHVEARLRVPEVDLAALIGRAPPQLRERLPVKGLTGKVRAEVVLAGSPPPPGAKLDLARPPGDARVDLTIDGLALEMPKQKLVVGGLGGKLGVEVRAGRAWLDGNVRVAELVQRKGASPVELRGAVLSLGAGLRDEIASLETTLTASAVRAGPMVEGGTKDVRLTLDVTHAASGDLDVRRLEIALPEGGLDARFHGRLARRRYGALRPEMKLTVAADTDKLKTVIVNAALARTSGRVSADVELRSPDDERIELEGSLGFDRFAYVQRGVIELRNMSGRIPVRQRLEVPGPRPVPEGVEEEGLAAPWLELARRMEELADDVQNLSRYELDTTNVLVAAPRTADYEALRPYGTERGARLGIEELVAGKQHIRAMSMDALWDSGVLRLDRFALQVFEGDVFGDFALQIPSEDDLRIRVRATATRLNLDVPFSTAVGAEPSKDPAEKAAYTVSGVLDMKLAMREQTIGGTLSMDMGEQMFLRIIGALDPFGKDPELQERAETFRMLANLRTVFGVGLKGVNVRIEQNLLNVGYVWREDPMPNPVIAFKEAGFLWGMLSIVMLPIRPLQATGEWITERFGKRVDLSIQRLAKPIERRSLGEVWNLPMWANLRRQLQDALGGRIAVPRSRGEEAIASP